MTATRLTTTGGPRSLEHLCLGYRSSLCHQRWSQASIEVIPANSIACPDLVRSRRKRQRCHPLQLVRLRPQREWWSSNGVLARRVNASALPIYTISGLANGVPYLVGITAVNAVRFFLG